MHHVSEWQVGPLLPTIQNALDLLDDRVTDTAGHNDQEEHISLLRTLSTLADLPPKPDFRQPVGTSVDNFTVGDLATMVRCHSVGVITDVRRAGGRRRVIVEFARPQPVDLIVASRFELDSRNITSTRKPALDGHAGVLRRTHDLIHCWWANTTSQEGRVATGILNQLRTAMRYLEKGLDPFDDLPKRSEPRYEIMQIAHDGSTRLHSAYQTFRHAVSALDAADEDPSSWPSAYVHDRLTGRRSLSFRSTTFLMSQGMSPEDFWVDLQVRERPSARP